MSRSKDVTNDEILPQSERLQALSPEEYELVPSKNAVLLDFLYFSDRGQVALPV